MKVHFKKIHQLIYFWYIYLKQLQFILNFVRLVSLLVMTKNIRHIIVPYLVIYLVLSPCSFPVEALAY